MVEKNLTSIDDQGVGGSGLICVKVWLMLNTDMCFISGILLARICKISSVRLEMFGD